jgi:carbonic anhydrase
MEGEQKMFRITAAACFLTTTLSVNVLAGDHGHNAHWSYEGHGGPEHWAELDKANTVCGAGQRQSPIDIANTTSAGLEPIAFDYRSAALEILNNGHTIQVNRSEGSSISVDGEKYELVQFHFHTPSENTVGGKPYDMEMHLVHKNAAGRLAVVGMFMKAGAGNSALAKAWDHMPSHAGKPEQVASVSFNPADLLPANKTYTRFNGSLTTPPCSEDVKWFVMQEAVEVSAAQVKQFAQVVGANARPTQPLNGRFVLSAK